MKPRSPRRLQLALLLVCGFAATAAGAGAKEMPVPDRELKETHIKNLGQRKGYNNKVWDRFLQLGPEYEDLEIMDAIFSARIPDGQPAAQYGFDLLTLFKADPAFFVRAGERHYQGNLDCLVHFLVPRSQLIEFGEISSVLDRELQAHPDDARLKRFRDRARIYFKGMKNGAALELRGCVPAPAPSPSPSP